MKRSRNYCYSMQLISQRVRGCLYDLGMIFILVLIPVLIKSFFNYMILIDMKCSSFQNELHYNEFIPWKEVRKVAKGHKIGTLDLRFRVSCVPGATIPFV